MAFSLSMWTHFHSHLNYQNGNNFGNVHQRYSLTLYVMLSMLAIYAYVYISTWFVTTCLCY